MISARRFARARLRSETLMIMKKLKEATIEQHDALESVVDVMNRMFTKGMDDPPLVFLVIAGD